MLVLGYVLRGEITHRGGVDRPATAIDVIKLKPIRRETFKIAPRLIPESCESEGIELRHDAQSRIGREKTGHALESGQFRSLYVHLQEVHRSDFVRQVVVQTHRLDFYRRPALLRVIDAMACGVLIREI